MHSFLSISVSFNLLTEKVYIVGRKQGDITFPDDQSVSRVHAELKVEHSQGNIVCKIYLSSHVYIIM